MSLTLPEPRQLMIIMIRFYAVGLVLLIIPPAKPFIEILTPFTLLLTVSLIFLYHEKLTIKHVVIYSIIALSGYFAEVAGVKTGLIFGDYEYKHVLGLKLLDTPLIIGINWLMLIYFTNHLTMTIKMKGWLRVVAGSLIMLGYDIFLEPVAVRMNMWSWSAGTIPLQNYAAWFVISIVFLAILQIGNIRQRNRIATPMFILQSGFIISLNLLFRIV